MTHSDWQSFLSGQGAVVSEGTTQSFGDVEQELRAAMHESIVADLSHLALVEVHGVDATDFLQGQLTNDVTRVSPALAQPSAWCNAKGRVITGLMVFERDGGLFLQAPHELSAKILQRLRLFVLRAKVSLDDASARLVRIGVSGHEVHARLAETLANFPETEYATRTADALTLCRLPGTTPRTEIVGPMQAMKPVWELAASHATRAGAQAWKLADILAGLPTVYSATSEHFLPQMLNMDALSAVSFKKGCYVGQEIVARTQHLGRIKRRMFLAKSACSTLPAPGADILGGGEHSVSVGTIVDAQHHPDGGSVSLAVLKLQSVEEPLHLKGAEQSPLEIIDPPYNIK